MKTDQGTLRKMKNGFMVELPTKRGTAKFPIPEAARCFHDQDAEDGTIVEVQRDAANCIIKVVVPGTEEVTPGSARTDSRPTSKPRRYGDRWRGRSQPKAIKNLPKASAKVLGSEFHNPYTFLPFSSSAPRRHEVTPLSVDELKDDRSRQTGVLELRVTTESPLLTCHPDPVSIDNGHKTYKVLSIGNDVIVPATGIRGSLRTLLTVLTGGTLGYLNEHVYLCQGRDANLGPRGPSSPPGTPAHVFLAEVEQPGTAFKSGTLRLGKTLLVKLEDLEAAYQGRRLPREHRTSTLWVGLDSADRPCEVSHTSTSKTPWKVKVSGRPISLRGKREGLFLAGSRRLELPPEFWAAYSGRNTFGDRPELRRGDLVWLEPSDPEATDIALPDDVKSIQWARWGKRGQAMKDKIPKHVLPDYMQTDGNVDEITDLFGQASPRRGEGVAFAARIRPENLVFHDAASDVERVSLAPLAAPHPGCLAFYRDSHDPDGVSEVDGIRGYKVYRTSQRGDEPWRYDVQGVYGEQGELSDDPKQKVNNTCDLMPKGKTGTLRIAFRGLERRELALLVLACSVKWRLGGGKPLGLGLCRVEITAMIDEKGQDIDFDDWEQKVSDLHERVRMWQASQEPVARMRYPRAVDDNHNRKTRGGHAWFARHAKPRMVTGKGDGVRESGLEPMHIDGAVKEEAEKMAEPFDPTIPMVSGQVLPQFDAEHPQGDVLYGYDAVNADTRDDYRPRKRVFLRVEPFDPETHVTGQEKSEGNQGKNAEFRERLKAARRGDYPTDPSE